MNEHQIEPLHVGEPPHPEPPQASTLRQSRKTALALVLWAVAIAAAFALDHPVANWMYSMRPALPRHHIEYQNGPLSREDWLAKVLRIPGEAIYPVLVVGVILIARRERWLAGGFVALVAATASGVNALLKWTFGRIRPLRPGPAWDFFSGGWNGLIHLKTDVSFASGHAVLAFAVATAVSVIWPRAGRVLYIPAVIVGIERIAENAHYLSDVVVAAFVAWGCARGIAWAFARTPKVGGPLDER
jgi:membrane-associated phospholipid phosphatase